MEKVSNHYYGKVEQYTDIPAAHLGGQIALGQGVNMNDPGKPIVKSVRPFEVLSANELMVTKPQFCSDDIVITNATVKVARSEVEEANILSEHFSASYGVFNASQALTKARELKSTFYTIYLLLEIRGETMPRAEDPQLDIQWKESPESEKISDKEECYSDLSRRYGTHYLSRKQYGLRLGIQAKVSKEEQTDQTKVEAEIGAAIGAFKAKTGISNDNKESLKNMNAELLLSCTGGIHHKDGSPYADVGSNPEDINSFMKGLAAGEVLIDSSPISYTLDSYWQTLKLEWEHTREALSPTEEFAPPPASFGVPSGTVLPWNPLETAIRNIEKPPKQSVPLEVLVPDGWALCDGSNGTPNLLNKFIRGTNDISHVSELGGNEKHTHKVTIEKCKANIRKHGGAGSTDNMAKDNHTHIAKTEDTECIPPYVSLLYIMKL